MNNRPESLLAQNARGILTRALSDPIGVEVAIEALGMPSPVLRAKQVLYRFKKEDNAFDVLRIFISPKNPETHLWIIREDGDLGQFLPEEGEPSPPKDLPFNTSLLDLE